MSRLPTPAGQWINRDQPIEFRFEGDTHRGFAGDVLSSALWANGVRVLGRSFKYHRPRGIYSMANLDVNAMVEDVSGRRTNLRGDVLPIEPGLDVCAVNTAGGVKRDRLRITERFGSFMPVGFYYKAFHRPRSLFPFYERQMRKVAGLGSINPGNTPQSTPKEYAFCDLLVVGAGPAGMSAAIEAAEQGLRVLLVDEQPHMGASGAWQFASDEAVQRTCHDLARRAGALDNLEIRCGTQVGGWYADHWIALIDDQRLTKLRTAATLVATGCFEQPAVFANNDLPGVMLGSAAQRLIHLYGVKPFERAVVLAANSDGYRMALDLDHAGVDVAALVDMRLAGEASQWASRISEADIPLYLGHAVYEAHPRPGKSGIKAALIRPVDQQGRVVADGEQHIDCDGIAMSVGWMPACGLLYQAGVRFSYSRHIEQLVPGQLPAGLFAAGRVNGVFAFDDQLTDGRRAALEAAVYLGKYDGIVPKAPTHNDAPPSHPYPIVVHEKKKAFVDLDEDIHLKDFVNAHQEGYDNVELLKRYTTVGMGPSQGKLSNMNATRILARLNDTSINETGTTTSRPMHQPVSINHLAGRRFAPLRRTPMHRWHAGHGAQFIHAGDWLRPEYYRDGSKARDDCILDEARRLRQGVGLIDVGTLGKITVSGPDAVAFLERIYTGRFAKQPIGRVRYALACDEGGVIIEDGVIARLAEDRFYVTATSSGVGAFYREMQRWAIIWQMDVVLANVTGQLAAMNIAGPQSRHVMEALTDIDLSADAFAYLGVREGMVVGATATVLRVGFVGELGYEIHVPASHGLQVWTKLINAGQTEGIGPFGVEAQRLLRLEKGHIIVSQDTDALTHPYEAGLAWAIGKNKQFFIGQRSIGIMNKQLQTRKLVGIAFDENYQGPLPEECHLIIDGSDIAGRVTSIAHRSTLGYAIGLAFVRPDQAEPGTLLCVRTDGGCMVEARVAAIPFYDPENQRQN